MIKPIQFSPRLALIPQGRTIDPRASWAALRELEMQANMAELRSLQRLERRNQFIIKLVDCWPIAVGLVLAFCAPAVQAFIAASAPWAMPVVFPFVVLAGRPELHLPLAVAQYLPLFVLYAQFPVEALIAKKILKRHIKFSGVALQICFYHFLGAMQLLLINGTLRQLFTR